jgi:hypothetical protein
MKKLLILISIILLVIFTSCASNNTEELPIQNNDDLTGGTFPIGKATSEICNETGGTWIESANECEGISANVCQEMGGTFNECGSACRNNPDAQACTLQCVQYCAFE